jgi:hypothetical protein
MYRKQAYRWCALDLEINYCAPFAPSHALLSADVLRPSVGQTRVQVHGSHVCPSGLLLYPEDGDSGLFGNVDNFLSEWLVLSGHNSGTNTVRVCMYYMFRPIGGHHQVHREPLRSLCVSVCYTSIHWPVFTHWAFVLVYVMPLCCEMYYILRFKVLKIVKYCNWN